MENQKDILSRLNRCCALLSGICTDFSADVEFSDI